MPEKFTFPTIGQAMSLQSAQSMEDIKVSLRSWFNQDNSLKLSENVAWSFKISSSELLIRRYIHCKFCLAKLIYVKENDSKDNKSSTFKLTRFNLHHDHRFIQSVKQKGKMKTFPQNYPNPEYSKHSNQKERRLRKEKLRKKRYELNKFKKLELYYRLNLMVKEREKYVVNVKQLAAKSIGVTQERFMSFLNSNTRGVLQVSGIKKLLKNAGFQKYNIDMDNTNRVNFNKSPGDQSDNQNQANSQEQDNDTNQKQKRNSMVIEQSREFFKQLMIFINYNSSTKKNLQLSQGLINITLLKDKVCSKKFMKSMRWDVLVLYSHDGNYIPNQLYGIIMIESSKFSIRQIKKCFEITFRLLNPMKKMHLQCCIHQENIFIMGALDLIIEEGLQRKNQQEEIKEAGEEQERKSQRQQQKKYEKPQSKQSLNAPLLSYFLSPSLSSSIITKCQFIPRIFRSKLIQKIYELDPKQIDEQFHKIISQLQKASQIQQFKKRTEEYISELKQFYENLHKIFIGKFTHLSFVGLIFAENNQMEVSMNQLLEKRLKKYSDGSKCFLQFLIMLFEVFQQPGGSFIYNKYQGDIRQPTRLQTNYANFLVMNEPQHIDQLKKLYNNKAFKSTYLKHKSVKTQKINADYYEEFSAILYEKVYCLKEVFAKIAPEVATVLIKEIQKSFTLQIQTRTLQQLKNDGLIKTKEGSKHPNIIKIINQSKFWPQSKQKKTLNSTTINTTNLIELEKPSGIIELDRSNQTKQKHRKEVELEKSQQKISKKLWQCDCNFSKFTLLPCCHQIRCCLTFFTSIEDQVDDFWLFDPQALEMIQNNSHKSDIITEDEESFNENQEKQGQENSESD